jgi:hypothetical protein
MQPHELLITLDRRSFPTFAVNVTKPILGRLTDRYAFARRGVNTSRYVNPNLVVIVVGILLALIRLYVPLALWST